MGRIKDFLAKWQTIERPEWEREKMESKKKLKYSKELTDDERDAVVKKEAVNKEDAGHEISVFYDEVEGDSFEVYAIFEDSETQKKVHLESFDHRKDAKDRLEGLLDEYTEIENWV